MGSVCDFHDGIPQHAVADAKALFKLLHDNALAVSIILDVHDGVVAVGVKWLADGFDRRHTELIERGVVLVHDPLKALAGGIVCRGLRQSAGQTVVHRQELFERVAADVRVDRFALAGAAAAVVVIFSEQAEVLIFLRREIGFDLFFRLFLFFGFFFFFGFLLVGLFFGLLDRGLFGLFGLGGRVGLYVFSGRSRFRRRLLRSFSCSSVSSPLMISLLSSPGGGSVPPPSSLERPAAMTLSFAATLE